MTSSEDQNPGHQNNSEPRLLTRRDLAPSVDEPATAAPRRSLFSALDRLQRKQARNEEAQPKRRRHLLRRIFLVNGILACVALLALLVGTLWLRHSMRAALPQLDGTLHVSGLSAPVTVTRDAQGVPAIRAASLDDLLFAQGFVTAQDRLFQMDALRRHAAGELAAILGPALVDHDRQQRTLQIRSAADRAIAVLAPDQMHQLEAYARGINALIDQHRDTLPVEFHLLHYTPAPWTPRDTLLVSLAMAQDLSTEYPTKLAREKLSAHLPAELLTDLYPVGSFRDRPPTQPPTDLTTPQEEIEQIPLDRSQSSVTPQDLLRYTASTGCADCRSGSNNWAVAGSRSASGAPLLSNDMHLGLSVPDIWYEAALHTADGTLDVAGFSLPGVPFIIAGRNAHVAWGFTAQLADVQDIHIEHLRGAGTNIEFQHPNGSWSLVHHHAEHIVVRGGHDVTLDVLTTEHAVGTSTVMETPILSPLYPSEKRALSLSWNIYDPVNITSPLLAVDTAADGASLVAAFATFGAPSLNLVYADEHHIGYHSLGRIPIRGPATQHPRTVPELVLPSTLPSTNDDEEDESGSPQTMLTHPHLMVAGYRPEPARRKLLRPAPSRPTPDMPIVPPAPPRNFTIGSPISPIPTDSLDASQVWSGYIPYSELPSIVDPPNGVLATANARITADDYPYFIANDWADPYRVERISRKLTGRTNLTPADMLALENDVHSDFDRVIAQRLAYAIDHASKSALSADPKRLHEAADILRSWDGEVTATSPAAAIVGSTRTELWPMLLVPAIRAHDHAAKDNLALAQLYLWGERNTALELLLQHNPARWLPSGYANWDDLLTTAVASALKRGAVPHSLASWKYGAYHQVEIAHPIFGSHRVFSHILGVPGGTGLQPTGGDFSTPKATGLHFGPSERFTADLANPEATTANITTGQSGNPASEWYLDQFLPWLRGTTYTLPLAHPNEVHLLTLTP